MPAEDSETYYRRTLTIPFFDQLVTEMNARFLATQSLVPAAMDEDWKSKALELAEFYRDDLPDADNLAMNVEISQLLLCS